MRRGWVDRKIPSKKSSRGGHNSLSGKEQEGTRKKEE